MRRGLKKDLNTNQLKPGEFAVPLDSKEVYVCFAPGDTKQMSTKEDMKEHVKDVTVDIAQDLSEDLRNATQQAQQAVQEARTIIGEAEVSVANANDQAQYATAQGDYAKQQADFIQDAITNGITVNTDFEDLTNVPLGVKISNKIFKEEITSTDSNRKVIIEGASSWNQLKDVPIFVQSSFIGTNEVVSFTVNGLSTKYIKFFDLETKIFTDIPKDGWIHEGEIYCLNWDGTNLNMILPANIHEVYQKIEAANKETKNKLSKVNKVQETSPNFGIFEQWEFTNQNNATIASVKALVNDLSNNDYMLQITANNPQQTRSASIELYSNGEIDINSTSTVTINGVNILEELNKITQQIKTSIVTRNSDLNNYKTDGKFYFPQTYTPTNIPAGVNGILEVFTVDMGGTLLVKQMWYRHGTNNTNDFETYIRTFNGSAWSNWKRFQTV